MTDITAIWPSAKRPPKMVREPSREVFGAAGAEVVENAAAGSVLLAAPKPPSKAAQVVDLLRRSEGATLAQLLVATGWLPHTVRAALTGLRKKGHAVMKDKVDGATRYTIAGVSSE